MPWGNSWSSCASALLLMCAPSLLAQQFITAKNITPSSLYDPAQIARVVVTGDFNGDGRRDFIVNNYNNVASVVLQNSNGTFTAKTIPSTLQLGATQAADVNGDGKLDLVTLLPGPTSQDGPPPTGSATLVIYLGYGDGTFSAGTSYSVANPGSEVGTLGFDVRDFTGDGKPDVAVLTSDQYGVTTLETFLNQSGGKFAAGPVYSNPPYGRLFGSADFNRDGKADLLVANGGKLQVLTGNGNGGFTPGPTYAPPVPALGVVIGDLNHDGNPDLVISPYPTAAVPNPSTQYVLLGTGHGTFNPGPSLNATGATVSTAGGVFLADMNRDGNLDVLVSSGSFSTIFLGKGDGTFKLEGIYDSSGDPRDQSAAAAVVDFNGDGYPDVLSNSDASYALALNDKHGNLYAPRISPAGNANSIGSGDFNRDGKQDVAVVNAAPCDSCKTSVTVLTGTGAGYFNAGHTYQLGLAPATTGNISVGDVNGDGKLDLVITRGSTKYTNITGPDTSILLGNGDGTFKPAMNLHVLGLNHGFNVSQSVFLVDVNNDHKLDLVGDWGVALGNGNGSFQAPIAFPNIPNISAIAVADFNRDGKLDVALGQEYTDNNQPEVYVLLGNGKGSFTVAHQQQVSSPGVVGISAVDLNHDGKADLIWSALSLGTVTQQSGTLNVQFGNGNGTFQAPVVYPTRAAGQILTGDFNRDGFTDVLLFALQYGYSSSYQDRANAELFLGGSGGKLSADSYYVSAAVQGVVMNLNSDGALDVAGATAAGVERILNTGRR